jgi:arsenate reductase
MAEALLRLRAGGRHEGSSAGSQPAERVHPVVVSVLAELGADISTRIPRRLTEEDAAWADVVVSMGCGDACPVLPGKRYVEWSVADPAGRSVEEVRAVRQEIERRIDELLRSLDLTPTHEPSTSS